MRRNPTARAAYRWVSQLWDPLKLASGLRGFARFLRDWRVYRSLPGAEPCGFLDTQPQVHDRTDTTPIDAHYFHMNAWAIRRILAPKPAAHVDVASQAQFVSLLSASVPTTFLDYRPLTATASGLTCVGGSVLQLPWADGSVASLSSLSVIEHVGLGRYGDPLDPQGTAKAAKELVRVLAPGGNLFVAVPVGKPRVCFNAHRIFSPSAFRALFAPLELVEFSGVRDDDAFVERAKLEDFETCRYANGLFWFRRGR